MSTERGVASEAERAGREVKDHPVFDLLVRWGLVAYGLVYLVLGWLALQLVFGAREGKPSKSGALRELAQQPWGKGVLWASCVGLAALVLWQALEAWVGHRSQKGAGRLFSRVASAGRVVLYGVLSWSCGKVASGHGSDDDPDGYTGRLMSLPWGPWLVAAVGAGIIVYAAFSAYKGLSDQWAHHLDWEARTGTKGTVTTVLARAGYTIRGVAFAIVGGLFVWAAVTHNPDKSGNLDAALGRLLDAPLGPTLVAIVAVGFLFYGLFHVVRASYHAG